MVTYLGKQVGQGQVCPVAAEVQATIDPISAQHAAVFWGKAGFYRVFCRRISDVVAPLISLANPETPFQWSERCQFAFETSKALLCSGPVLAAPNFGRPVKLEVDARAFSVGTVLLQEDESCLYHPVCYFQQFNRHQLHCRSMGRTLCQLSVFLTIIHLLF